MTQCIILQTILYGLAMSYRLYSWIFIINLYKTANRNTKKSPKFKNRLDENFHSSMARVITKSLNPWCTNFSIATLL